MPPESQLNKDFLKAVFADEKKLLKKKQVDYISVNHWDELSVHKLWPDLKDDAAFNIYFQDTYADQKDTNREYFFNILNTIYTDYLSNVINNAAK